MYSRFVALRIRPAGRGIRRAVDDPELPERWLLAEWPADASEPVQFWLSSLPSGMPLATLVRLAKLRWRIEHDYREMKQALGLAHFEGRTWTGWHHHVTLVSAATHSAPCNDWPTTQKIQRGLSLYQAVRELQTLLATWTGACPTCHRDIPTPIRT